MVDVPPPMFRPTTVKIPVVTRMNTSEKIREAEVGLRTLRAKLEGLPEGVFRLGEHAAKRVDSGDGGAEFGKRLLGIVVPTVVRPRQELGAELVPVSPVTSDDVGPDGRRLLRRRQGIIFELHDNTGWPEIRVHPGNGVTFLDVERVLGLVALENPAGENPAPEGWPTTG